MNRRVQDEASLLVALPDNLYNWEITDIGEGHRTDSKNQERYEEEIYQEIVAKVRELFPTTISSR